MTIYHHVMERIRNGKYKPGEKIESIRTLSARFNFQRGIGLYALRRLVDDGTLYSEPHRGFFVYPTLDSRRYYRIGYFLNEHDPMRSGANIQAVNLAVLQHGYRAILGMNFREDTTLADFLTDFPNLDGVILDGIVTEKVVSIAKRFRIPYLVLGNHDISPEHPQKRIPVRQRFFEAFSKALEPYQGKRGGFMIGDLQQTNEQEAAAGLKDAFRYNHIRFSEKDILECSNNGDNIGGCLDLIQNNHLDFLCMWGTCSDIYRAAMQISGLEKHPLILYGAHPFRPGDAKLFDVPVHITQLDAAAVTDGVEMLFAMIDKQLENCAY